MKKVMLASIFVVSLLVFGSLEAQARNQIRIVGSSTVYPFASYVAEEFGVTTKYPTPVVEATGSGGGMKLFSAGVELNTPDICNTSRRIKVSELKRCLNNGVKKITEVIFGYDGIALAQNIENPELKLSLQEITLAVAAEVPQNGKLVKNPYQYWNQIDPELPHRKILIYGPPSTSGTRDAFEELCMEAASEKMSGYGGKYTKIRQDGLYVPSGENDNLIVQRLIRDQSALGIFGYSFLEQNQGRIEGAIINGFEPKPETISSGNYPLSRSLFFYVKKEHIGKVPGIREYVELFLSEKMIGKFGYLKGLGLIPLPVEKRKKMRASFEQGEVLSLDDLMRKPKL